MPLGGKKKKKGKKKNIDTTRKVRLCGAKEEYAQVKSLFGDRRVEISIPKKGLMKAHIPGRFRKRMWINRDDWVLVQQRDCNSNEEANIYDIIHLYTTQEVRKLNRMEEIQTEGSEEDIFSKDLEFKDFEKMNYKKNEIEYPSSFTASEEEEEEEEEEI